MSAARSTHEQQLSLRLWPPLVLIAAVMTLAAVGLLPRWPGLVHAVALPPLDLVHDLRVLLARAPNLPAFVLGATLSIAARSALLALLLGGLTPARFLFALRFYGVALIPALVAATVLFAAPAILFASLFWAGFGVVVVMLLVLGNLPWTGRGRVREGLRRSWRRRLRAGTVLAYAGLLVGVGAAADLLGGWWILALVPVSAALTVFAAVQLGWDRGPRLPGRVLGGLAAAVLALLVLAAATAPSSPQVPAAESEEREGSLLLMSGMDSASGQGANFEIDPVPLGYGCAQVFHFSYAGPGSGQPRGDAACPIRTGAPYGPEDTLRSSSELVEAFVEQVEELPEPVVVMTHSQGVWVAWDALATHGALGVSHLVLVGSFPRNPLPYPTDGDTGPGRAGYPLLRLLAELPRPGGTSTVDPDSPLARDYLADRDRIEEVFAQPLPAGVEAITMPSVFDLPVMPEGDRIEGAAAGCPVRAVHPDLPYSAELQERMLRFLDGEPQPRCPAWRRAVGPAVRAFTVPSWEA